MTDTEFERLIFDLKDSGDLTDAGLATLVDGLDRYRKQADKEENERILAEREENERIFAERAEVSGMCFEILGDLQCASYEERVIRRHSADWEAGADWAAQQFSERMLEKIEDL